MDVTDATAEPGPNTQHTVTLTAAMTSALTMTLTMSLTLTLSITLTLIIPLSLSLSLFIKLGMRMNRILTEDTSVGKEKTNSLDSEQVHSLIKPDPGSSLKSEPKS